MDNLKQRLNMALKRAGMSKAEFARCVGISAQAVGQLCNGETKTISMENLFTAADCLRVNVRWLATGEGPMTLENADIAHLTGYINQKLVEHVFVILEMEGEPAEFSTLSVEQKAERFCQLYNRAFQRLGITT